MFDWLLFFDQRGIEYATSGPNVGRGHIAVKCPFCGAADHSEHMSIALSGAGWRCLRNPQEHRGRSPIALIRALTGCSMEEAQRIVGIAPATPSAGLFGKVKALLAPELDDGPPANLPEPPEFRLLSDKPSARPFMQYLERRGFYRKFLLREGERLGLRYAVRGPFGGRIMFLVRDGGALVTWTGRTLSPRQPIRYKELPADAESAESIGLPPASVPLHSCLLWQDEFATSKAPVLCLVEGPMDALKLRMLARGSVLPTAMFTNALSDSQIGRLRMAVSRFESCVLLLDRGAENRAINARRTLTALGVEVRWLPDGVDDPGELSPQTFAKLALDCAPELRL